MQTATRPRSSRVRASAALTALTCLVLAGGAGLASARTRSCARISNCATHVVVTPPPEAVLGGTPSSVGSFGVVVKLAPTSTLATRGQPGRLIATAAPSAQVTCPGYQLKDPVPLVFQLKTVTPVHITYEITDRLTNTTIDAVHFCLAASFPFKTMSGRPARAAKLPDGTRGHIGLLPDCPKPLPPAGAATAPCVESVSSVPDSHSTTNIDVLLRVRVPTQTKGGQSADPWGGG